MNLKAWLVGLALALASAAPAAAQTPPPALGTSARTVVTWIPPYNRAISWRRLNELYGGNGPANSITRLGLQFWKPTTTGGLVRVSAYGAIGDAEIRRYVDWAHRNGVEAMLTVYNGEPTWDWALAKSAFGPNRTAFIRNLIAEMNRQKLDGIDIDLEGPGMDPTPDDKAQYLAFMTELSRQLRLAGKLLQIDTFSYIYNAPNQTWWPQLFPLVDTVASMGYEEIGKNGAGWAAFSAQRAEAKNGVNMDKLVLGLPSYRDEWLGDPALVQVAWFVPRGIRVGVGIWDVQLPNAPWRKAPTWRLLKQMRDQTP